LFKVYVNNKLQLIDIEFDKSITHVKLNGPISPGKFEKALRNQSALLPPTTPNTLGCDITGEMSIVLKLKFFIFPDIRKHVFKSIK